MYLTLIFIRATKSDENTRHMFHNGLKSYTLVHTLEHKNYSYIKYACAIV